MAMTMLRTMLPPLNREAHRHNRMDVMSVLLVRRRMLLMLRRRRVVLARVPGRLTRFGRGGRGVHRRRLVHRCVQYTLPLPSSLPLPTHLPITLTVRIAQVELGGALCARWWWWGGVVPLLLVGGWGRGGGSDSGSASEEKDERVREIRDGTWPRNEARCASSGKLQVRCSRRG